ncbi:MAG: tetratricopeptide repeat protein, partial [Acidobacteriota bacterium]
PFLGASSAELMAAIQRDEAVPLETVRSDLPPHLSQIVHQCLQKGPALRFQSAQEVFDELTALKREVVSVAFASGTRTGGTRSGATRSGGTRSRVWSTVQAESADRTKPRWAAALGVLAALAVVLAIALGVGWPRSETHPETASNGTPLTRSIAVLPFENRSGDAANEYFSDGLSEELLNRLAQVPGLRVAARTSSFFFKGHSGEISEIGRRLNVSVILEGSVRKAGNRIKVAASLVDVAEGYQLWAHTYDRELDDVFALQEEIATTVVDALKITLIGESAARLAERSTDNVAAYDAYLLGRHRLVSRNSTDLEEAVAYFEEAARLDPGFAQAHIGRAMTLAMLGFYALRPPEDFMAEAGLSARRALALDSQLGEAHAVLGYLQHRLGRDVEAEPAFERALELNPSFVYTYLWRGSNLGRLGRLEESIELLQKGLRIDPLDPTLHTYVGWSLSLLGRWDEALAALRRATEISPDHATALTLRGWIHALDGRFDLAVRQFRQAIKADGGAVLALSGLVWAYVALDELDQADQWIGHFSTLAPGNPWLANSKLLLHWARGEPGPMLEAARDTLASPVVDTYLALALRELAQADHQAERPADGLDRYRGRHPGLFEEPPQLDLRWQYDSALASAVDLAALLRATGDRSAGDRLLAHCLLTLQADPRPISPLRVFNPLAETTLHAVRGDKAAALSALRAAIDRGPLLEGESSGGWRGNPRALRLHPHLQILQDEPEFQAIVAEVEADLVRMRQALEQDDATASGR